MSGYFFASCRKLGVLRRYILGSGRAKQSSWLAARSTSFALLAFIRQGNAHRFGTVTSTSRSDGRSYTNHPLSHRQAVWAKDGYHIAYFQITSQTCTYYIKHWNLLDLTHAILPTQLTPNPPCNLLERFVHVQRFSVVLLGVDVLQILSSSDLGAERF